MAIIVSGSGISGLSVALAAANAGHKVRMFGQAPLKFSLGGIQLAPNGWQALVHLGLFDSAVKHATRLGHILVRDLNTAATLTRLPLTNHYASISRADLLTLLRGAVTSHPSIECQNTFINQIITQEDGIQLIYADSRSMRAEALIAADGVNGLGRRFVTGTNFNSIDHARRVVMRAEVCAGDLPAAFSQPTSNLWLGQGAHLVHYPIAGGARINFAVTLSAKLANNDWRAQIFYSNPMLKQLANRKFKWIKTSLLPAGSPLCWRRGRVVLAGDAAHIMPPHLAQGAGQALQDAACLQQTLTFSKNIDEALGTYVRCRTTAVSAVVQKADISGRVMALGGFGGRLRNIMISLAGPSFLQSWLADVWAGDSKIAK